MLLLGRTIYNSYNIFRATTRRRNKVAQWSCWIWERY